MTTEQQACEQHFGTHKTHRPIGRFVVRLPTQMDPTQPGSARLSAEQGLHAIERLLERDSDLKFQYHNFMKEYEELGHMELVKSQEGRNMLLLPHHPVFEETSSTARTRIAFGGSAKPCNGTQQHYCRLLWPTGK